MKDAWDKLGVISNLVKIIIFWVFAFSINSSLKSKEINLGYIQLAIEILQSEPDESKINLRAWAISILEEHSTIPLNAKVNKELLNAKIPNTWNDNDIWDDSSQWQDFR